MKSAVLVFPGSNCDRDLAVAIEQVTGRAPAMVWHRDSELPAGTDLIAIPGGFSYGDYLRSGAMAARSPIMRAVAEAAGKGVPVLGICNGFQVLTEAGLLPGALMRNAGLHFVCRAVGLKVENSQSIFTSALCGGRGDQRSRSPTMTAITRPMPKRSTGWKAKAASPSATPARSTARRASIAGILNAAGQCARHDAAPRAGDRSRPMAAPTADGCSKACWKRSPDFCSALKRRAPGLRPPWLPR